MKVTRRGVLLGVLGASSAAFAAQRFPWEPALRSEIDDFVLELLRVVAVPNPLRVGEARLGRTPELKDDPRRLLDSVFADLPVAAVASARELAVILRDTALRQFETGDVVRAHGWILARVEADLCALIALDQGLAASGARPRSSVVSART